jgi:hypothetical protein
MSRQERLLVDILLSVLSTSSCPNREISYSFARMKGSVGVIGRDKPYTTLTTSKISRCLVCALHCHWHENSGCQATYCSGACLQWSSNKVVDMLLVGHMQLWLPSECLIVTCKLCKDL